MVCGLFAEKIYKSILNVCYGNCLPKVLTIVTLRIQISPTLECYSFVSVSRCLALQYRDSQERVGSNFLNHSLYPYLESIFGCGQ